MGELNTKTMDYYSGISMVAPNVISIIFCLYLFIDSKKTSSKFYYQIISPFFSYFIFSFLFLRLILISGFSALFIFWEDYPSKMRVIGKMVDLLFLRNLENISIYSRLISIKDELTSYKSRIIKPSNTGLSRYKESKSKRTKPGMKIKQNFISIKTFIVQIILLSILLFFCFYPLKDEGPSFIYSFFEGLSPDNSSSSIDGKTAHKDYKDHDTYGGIIILAFNNIYYLYAIIFLIQMLIMKIKKDTFYLRLEFSSLMIIILIENNLTYILGLLIPSSTKEYMFYIFDWTESLYSLIKIILLFIVYHKRTKYTSKNMEIMLGNAHFDDFIMNKNCFQIFKHFIRHSQENLNYLAFYLDYIEFLSIAQEKRNKEHNLQLNYKKDRISNKSSSTDKLVSQDETLIEKARDMFQNYFVSNSIDSSSILSGSRKELSSSLLKMSSQIDLDLSVNYLTINFPADIYEEVTKISQANFIVEHLESVYDEAYKWVLVQLNSVYEEFKNENIQMMNIQISVFFSDYFDDLNTNEDLNENRKLSDSLEERILPPTQGGNMV
ncbi:MAG: hypothetical protein MJ252_19325 [archaeon]|nr:hypothetical protein [archaeon]